LVENVIGRGGWNSAANAKLGGWYEHSRDDITEFAVTC
jgi:hypothetical protein